MQMIPEVPPCGFKDFMHNMTDDAIIALTQLFDVLLRGDIQTYLTGILISLANNTFVLCGMENLYKSKPSQDLHLSLFLPT